MSELALERHLAQHAAPISETRPIATSNDEEGPITQRCPQREIAAGARIVSVVLEALGEEGHARARAAVLEALVGEALPGDRHVETRELVLAALERDARSSAA